MAPPDPEVNDSVNARYDAIRKEIEAARKNLACGCLPLLYASFLSLNQLGNREPMFKDSNAVCVAIFDQSADYVFRIFEAWATTEALAEVGFSEQLLRGSEEAIDRKVSYADKEAFNLWRTKHAIKQYRHYELWKWCKQSI
jgi:hypothetical protein